MMRRDYYSILGVAPYTDSREIANAYRRLARKFHPDVSREPGCEERFKEICEAYQALRTTESRLAYDRAAGAPTSVVQTAPLTLLLPAEYWLCWSWWLWLNCCFYYQEAVVRAVAAPDYDQRYQ